MFNILKGFFGEATISFFAWLRLDHDVYKPINNLIIETNNGSTQIDHIIVSVYGIFVIETKNMKGWIFGDEKQTTWTQCLRGGKKYKFQNPLRQNYRHIKALEAYLGIGGDKFHSIVMFIGESQFKTSMPTNVLDRGYSSYIKSKTRQLLSTEEVDKIYSSLKSGKIKNSSATKQQHINSLKERFSSTTTCPKCGSSLILRTAKKGKNIGAKFYGCTAFPKCRFTKPINK